MTPDILPLPFEAGALDALSERLMTSHHANNYSGAVKRLHAIRGRLAELDWNAAPGFVINGLKREELVAANSMVLHELYFAGLGGDGVLPTGGLSVGIDRDFGSVARWRAEFVALATSLGGGSGWALLSWSAREQRLINHQASDHTQLLSGATPILALDMYEHAYHIDYGADAKSYVGAVMRNFAWARIAERYVAAVHASCEALSMDAVEVEKDAALVRLDVRRKGAFDASKEVIPGAVWRDPQTVDAWAPALRGQKVAVYCVYGHEVGQSTAARLRLAGVDAGFIAGGIVDWKAAGRPLAPR
ncbi:MAG TPA: Fe-Mn family superoxide dismutase [Burkholderiales bacterium]